MTVHRAVHPSTLLSFLVLGAILGCLRCGPITPAEVAAVEAACAGLTLVPGLGGLLMMACEGEERALAEALAAEQDAGPIPIPQPPPGSLDGIGRVRPTLVTRRAGSKRIPVGYVPREVAARVQARLDAGGR